MKVPCITQNTSFSEVGPQVMIHNSANGSDPLSAVGDWAVQNH
jgi:hypothetical protein